MSRQETKREKVFQIFAKHFLRYIRLKVGTTKTMSSAAWNYGNLSPERKLKRIQSDFLSLLVRRICSLRRE